MNSSIDTFVILGPGGHGRIIADVIRARFGARIRLEYVDKDPERVGEVCEPGGGRITRDDEALRADLASGLDAAIVLAVGDNAARLQLFAHMQASGASMPVIQHPSAVVSPSALVGAGTHLVTGAIVHAAARIGAATILNTGCIIEHDCIVGDGCHISPGAVVASTVTIGARTWIGAGATVINNVTVGSDVTVGAGSVVIDDVPDGATVVGVPARRIDV